MRKYELMFIVKPDLEEADIKSKAEEMKNIITSKKAKVIDFKEMGQKELAYEINKYKKGYYFLMTVESENDEAIKEFDRVSLINENIIRHLVVRIDN